MIRVLIADDQLLLRQGFSTILEARGQVQVVATAADGAQALDLCRRHPVDVALMDVRMPGMDGLEATRRIVAAGLHTRVLVLTTFTVDEYAWEAVRAGASGFLLKDISADDLHRSVLDVAAGDAVLDPAATRLLLDHLAAIREPAPRSPGPDISGLTGRELEVLVLLGRGASNGELAACLHLSTATVKSHVSNILAKLGLRDRAQAVIVAYEAGVIVPGY